MLMEMTSLSIWPPQLKQPPSVDPIEKQNSSLRRPDLISIEDLSMENRQLIETDNDEAFLCVNPYDVNPIADHSQLVVADNVCVTPLKSEINVQQNCSTISCRGFYGIKLEMEEFRDISSFILPRPMSTNSVDELNTPIFELKEDFDFGLGIYQTRIQPDFTVKDERDAVHRNGYVLTSEKNKDFIYSTEEVLRNDNITSEIGNIDNLQNAEVYSPASDNGTYIYNKTTVTDSVNDSALSVNSFSMPLDGSHYFIGEPDTPEDSDSSTYSNEKKRKLSLDTGRKTLMKDLISTPNIITEVVDLESANFETNFNILDLIKDDSISLVTSDDIFSTSPSCPEPAKTSTSKFLSNVSSYGVPVKQPRKRKKQVDDDDDDYIPPTKKNTHKTSIKVLNDDSESDSGSEIVFSNYRPRGRPPKRTGSIASEGSRDGDNSKYRELRDKNNEASRKSRQKRKIKEMELEKEANELRSKNIKLKAQVEELEKMVNNFRDNLFKLMMVKR